MKILTGQLDGPWSPELLGQSWDKQAQMGFEKLKGKDKPLGQIAPAVLIRVTDQIY